MMTGIKSTVGFLPFPARVILVVLAVSFALISQAGGSSGAKPQNPASVGDARQIAELSISATETNLEAWNHHSYTQRDEDRRLDSNGQVKSEDVEVTTETFLNGARFEQIVEHNGRPPSADEQRTTAKELDKLKHETPAEQRVRLGEDEENRSFLQDMVATFDFQLIGEEVVEGRLAYVLTATPHAGYLAHGKYGKIFSMVEGKFWIDEQDFGWIKVEGQVTQAFSMALFVARVLPGTHITLQEARLGKDVWVPKRMEVRASARILFLKRLEIDRILSYFNYDLTISGPYSADQ
jgi:hypothetical protein